MHAQCMSIRYIQQQRTHSYLLTPATTGHYLYFLVATVLGVYANISLAYLLTRLCEARLTCKLLYAGAVLPLQLLPLLRLLTRPFLSCGTLSFQLAFSLGLPGQFLLPRLALLIEALEALSLQVLCIAHLGIDIDK